MIAGLVSFGFSQDSSEEIAEMLNVLDGSITSIFTSITSNISKNIDANAQFYGSVGNVFVPNVSTYPGIRVGLGIGVNVPGYIVNIISQQDVDFISGLSDTDSNASYFDAIGNGVGVVLGLVPLPYDMIYFKMGLPESFLKTPITRYMDIGVRIGFLPDVIGWLLKQGEGTGIDLLSYDAGINAFHIGAEARTLLLGNLKVFSTSSCRRPTTWTSADSGGIFRLHCR
jgi:hypothetical protein